jgi:MoxR-like ATPase
MATQNPIETEGTYPLPEAQVDRFMMKVLVGYPSEDEEFVIVERVIGPAIDIGAVITTAQLAQLQKECRAAYVDPSLITYAVKLVAATREPAKVGQVDLAKYVAFGASPRATIWLIEGARALAFLRGRNYALPEDVIDLVPDVLRHRITLTYEAMADGITADSFVERIVKAVPAPAKPLRAANGENFAHPRSGFAAPPQGGTASGLAKPDPRRSRGQTRASTEFPTWLRLPYSLPRPSCRSWSGRC